MPGALGEPAKRPASLGGCKVEVWDAMIAERSQVTLGPWTMVTVSLTRKEAEKLWNISETKADNLGSHREEWDDDRRGQRLGEPIAASYLTASNCIFFISISGNRAGHLCMAFRTSPPLLAYLAVPGLPTFISLRPTQQRKYDLTFQCGSRYFGPIGAM